MLFIQKISICYYKNTRYPQFAVERERINFLPIELNPLRFEGNTPARDEMLDCEVLLQYELFWQYPAQLHHKATRFRQFGDEIFTEGEKQEYSTWYNMTENIRLFKEEDTYKVMFCDDGGWLCHSKRRGHNEAYNTPHSPFARQDKLNVTAFRLSDGDYGRIIYNNRYIDGDTGKWIHARHIYNIISCNKAAYREKMFYRKKPDYEYTNMLSLR